MESERNLSLCAYITRRLTFHISELARHAKDGEDSLRTGFKELKELGYVKRYPVRDGNTKNCKVGYGNLRNATKGHATNGKPRCGKAI